MATSLAGLHTLSRFLIAHYPEHMATFQGVLGIPFKRGMQKLPVDYLEIAEVEALLGGINQGTPSGRRDYALFALMLNTGARVQEILNLKIRDVRFDPPHQVRLLGKGNKMRLCPIWPRTAKLLRELTEATASTSDEPAEEYLFQNRRASRSPGLEFAICFVNIRARTMSTNVVATEVLIDESGSP